MAYNTLTFAKNKASEQIDLLCNQFMQSSAGLVSLTKYKHIQVVFKQIGIMSK